MQFLSGFEADGVAGGYGDFCPGAGVAADAGFARTNAEYAEAAELDSVSFCEGVFEAFEDGVNGSLGLCARQSGSIDDVVDDILLNQCLDPLEEIPAERPLARC